MASSDSTEAAALMSKALLTSIAAPIKSLEPRLSDFKCVFPLLWPDPSDSSLVFIPSRKEQDELLKKMESENADLESLQRGFESTELLVRPPFFFVTSHSLSHYIS